MEEKLAIYLALLKKWQLKINLISSNTLNDAWNRHFEDSQQINDYLPDTARIVFDLGSGAGFPGLVLAIINPELKVHLIESDQKKCSFLKTVSRETAVDVEIHNSRIEDVSCETKPDVVTARALASLNKLFDLCEGWILENPNISLIFPKGEKANDELSLVSEKWLFDCDRYASKTDAKATILVFTNIKKL